MRLTVVFMIAGCLQVQARATAQSISISEKNASLKKVFSLIEKQAGVTFFYQDELLRVANPVNISVRNASLIQALALCFQGQPFTYEIVGPTIVVKAKAVVETPEPDLPLPPVVNEIHGRVTDTAGNPLAGASVSLRKSAKGTQTDANGMFRLENVNDNVTLVVSFTGYATQEYKVHGQSEIIISLSRSVSPLDEIKIIAYGSVSQRMDVGNVSVVKAIDIEDQPVTNVMQALLGRIPGLQITSWNGLPGAATSVLLQGQNSINSGNDPFYVIDGVPYNSQLLNNLSSTTLILGYDRYGGSAGFNGGTPLSYINPSDIESISVLKDADATAIYGSQAANGAILITTKKGKVGEMKVDLDYQSGWGKGTHQLKLMNTPQYLKMRHQALYNDSVAGFLPNTQPGPGDYDINGLWDTTRSTDWQKALLGGTAQFTKVAATLSGGTTNMQYLVGGTYDLQTTVLPEKTPDRQVSLHFNITSNSANKKFHFMVTGSYLVDSRDLPTVDPTNAVFMLAPDAPAPLNKDGSINWAPTSSGVSSFADNPMAALYNVYKNKVNNLVSNGMLSYQVIPGLEVRANLGYTNQQQNEVMTHPFSAIPPESRPMQQRYGQYSDNALSTWLVEPQAEYKRDIGKGKLDLLVGSTIRQRISDGAIYNAFGFSTDEAIVDIHSGTNVAVSSSIIAKYKYAAVFGRLNYIYDDKYIVDLTARRDGSSHFGSANQFQSFGAVGAGWIFSKERWMLENLPVLSFGKLRVSYGVAGNDQITDYAYLSLYNPVVYSQSYQGGAALTPTGLSNPYLRWETVKKLNVGMNLGFLRDRIVLTADYARNISSDQLLPNVLPITTGFGSILINFPSTVQNTSLEFSVNSVNVRDGHFQWTTNFNLTFPRNKLVAFPNLANSSYSYNLVIGKPLSIERVFKYLGVDPATGLYQFEDHNGKPTISPDYLTDNFTLKNIDQRFFGGLENKFTYRNLQLSFLLQFTTQLGRNIPFGSYIPGAFDRNQPAYVADAWEKPGDHASIMKYNSTYGLYAPFFAAGGSDVMVGDASYIRLKTLTLSYQLPKQTLEKARIKNCRVFLEGQNLLTLTHYGGIDPENPQFYGVPPLRFMTIGVQLGL